MPGRTRVNGRRRMPQRRFLDPGRSLMSKLDHCISPRSGYAGSSKEFKADRAMRIFASRPSGALAVAGIAQQRLRLREERIMTSARSPRAWWLGLILVLG